MANEELVLRLRAEGVNTIDDLRKYIKALRGEWSGLGVTATEEQKRVGNYIKQLADYLSKISESAQSSNAKMMKSYFTLGEELRRFYMQQRVGDRTMNEVAQTMNLVGLNVSGLVSSFQQAEFAVGAFGIATSRAGGSLAALGSVITGMAVPLAMAVAGILAYVQALTQLSKRADEIITKYESLELKMAKTPGDRALVEERRRARIERRRDLEQRKLNIATATGFMPQLAMAGQMFGFWDVFALEEYQLDLQELDYEQRERRQGRMTGYAEEEMARRTEQKRAAERAGKKNKDEARDYLDALTKPTKKPRTWLSIAREAQTAQKQGPWMGTQAGVAITPAGKPEAALSDYEHGVMRLGGILQNTLGQAFVTAFNLGNSLLDQLAGKILFVIGQFLISKLASLIPGGFGEFLAAGMMSMQHGGVITEPVVGFGVKSRAGYLLGEAGPERVMPLKGGYGGDPMVKAINQLSVALSSGNWVELNYAMARSSRRTARMRM